MSSILAILRVFLVGEGVNQNVNVLSCSCYQVGEQSGVICAQEGIQSLNVKEDASVMF